MLGGRCGQREERAARTYPGPAVSRGRTRSRRGGADEIEAVFARIVSHISAVRSFEDPSGGAVGQGAAATLRFAPGERLLFVFLERLLETRSDPRDALVDGHVQAPPTLGGPELAIRGAVSVRSRRREFYDEVELVRGPVRFEPRAAGQAL